jgi:salicylate hydroxylase
MTLISPEIIEAYNKIKTSNFSPEKDHVWFDIRYGDGQRAGDLITEIASAKGFAHCGASRSHFLDGLVKLIPKEVDIVFGKKVVDILEDISADSGRIRVLFHDGSEVYTDAVIGCDGIRSACRQVLLGPHDKSSKAVYSGKYAYRGVVDMEKAVEAGGKEVVNRQVFVGEGGHLLMFPIKNGKALNIVAFRDAYDAPWTQKQWVVPSSRDELLKDFAGWAQNATRILQVRVFGVSHPSISRKD